MSYFDVTGGRRLEGAVRVHGAKNSVLPILAATVLNGGISEIENCPHLTDVETSIKILRHLGCRAVRKGDTLSVDTSCMSRIDVPDSLMREMRSSVIFLGAIIARCGEAQMSYPGGCELGPRPIDIHLSALRSLGARIDESCGCMSCSAEGLSGREIILSMPSVGATENIILAACGAEGTTIICNAAREPEIVDLQNFLRAMGADVSGAGSSTVAISGKKKLHDCKYTIESDRIVASTYLSAAAALGGSVTLENVDYRRFSTVVSALSEAGCRIVSESDKVHIESDGSLRAIHPVRTAPYPGFPTDAQAVLMAALLKAKGTTVFIENIFESRYRHVDEMMRLGANIRTEGRVAVVCGVEKLRGAPLRASDLRSGAALIIAALSAEGNSRVDGVHHIDRGYASISEDLHALGAEIERKEEQ